MQMHAGSSPRDMVLPVQQVLPGVHDLAPTGAPLSAEGFRRFARGATAASPCAAVAQPGCADVAGASPLERACTASTPGVLLHEGQNGFRPERSCADHQYVLHQILSGRRAEGKESYVLFVDVTEAFPRVRLDGL